MIKYIKKLSAFSICILLMSCGFVKRIEVPVQTVDKVIYRDSIVYIHDSIKIDVPYEKVKEIVAIMDTSYLKTNVAESIAYVDTAKRKIHHTLTQKGELTGELDTIIKVQYVNRVIEKNIPVKVEVIKYKRDSLFWVLSAWALICFVTVFLKLFILKK